MEQQSNSEHLEMLATPILGLEKFITEKAISNAQEQKLILEKLNYLSFHYNPYEQTKITPEVNALIDEFKLRETLDNPFEFTNRILQMLDIAQAGLH